MTPRRGRAAAIGQRWQGRRWPWPRCGRRAVASTLLLAGVLASARHAAAQDSTAAPPLPVRLRSVFAVPEVPAAQLLGGSSLEITRPGTMQDFASALVSGIDRTGRVRQGIALEVAPFTLWGSGIGLAAYRTPAGFAKANFRVSLATQRVTGDTGSTDVTIGIRTSLFDDRDLLRSKGYTDALGEVLLACTRETGPATPDAPVDTASFNQCVRDRRAALPASIAAPPWNSSSLVLAAAYGMRLDESLIRRSRGTGGRAWASYARGVGDWAQLLGYAAADYVRDRSPDSTYTSATGGVRVLVGSERVNGFYQNAFQWRKTKSASELDGSVGEWSAGIEFAAREGTWISTGIGSAYADVAAPDRVVVFANLRWGVASASRLSPRPGRTP